MAGKNYYAWLELPIEQFEGNPAKLSPIAEKKIMEWKSHKKVDIQNRANIHAEGIRRAINDPDEWKKIYLEYKAEVDEGIEQSLVFVADEKKQISKENIEILAKNNKVSEEYIKKICASNGYSLSTGNQPEKKTANITFKLDDMKPKAFSLIDSAHKVVIELGGNNLMELLKNPDIIGISISDKSSDADVLDALNKTKEKWIRIPQAGPKGTQKSHLDKVCSGFNRIIADYSWSEYGRFLRYLEAKEILTKITKLGVSELNEEGFNKAVKDLARIIGDFDKAKSALIAHCEDKKIAYPVERPKQAVCRFCGNSFDRADPIQQQCPVCRRSLVVKCPKCGKPKNLLVDTECDGINLGMYPILEESLKTIDEFCGRLNLVEAREELKELNSKWPGFPGTQEAQAKIDSLEKRYIQDIGNIDKAFDRKEYYTARTIIEKINGEFPGFKTRYGVVYSSIEDAEQEFEEAKKDPDVDSRVTKLLAINDYISDFRQLNTELQKYPTQPVTGLTAAADPYTGLISLTWQSANKPNSVFYSVRKKRDTMVSSVTDGEEIAKTQNLSFGDKNVEEGVAYYYAVFASRGPIQSALCPMSEPVIMLRQPQVTPSPKDGSIDLSWSSSAANMRVFYSEQNISNYDEGTEAKGVSDTGVLLEGLKNGVPYQIAVYKQAVFGGKEYRSPLRIINKVVPIKPIAPPRLTKSLGKEPGEYILSEESQSEEKLILYYSEVLVGIGEDSQISAADMEKKAKKLAATANSDGTYTVNMSGLKQMYVYPAYNVFGTLVVGKILPLSYVKPVGITAGVSGGELCLTISEWPEKAERVIVCYDFESFPQDTTDCDRANKVIVTKTEYNSRAVLAIPRIVEKDYYISLFAAISGNYIPIGTLKYSLTPAIDTSYEIKKGMLGGLKLLIHNRKSYRPELVFAVGAGGIPLTVDRAVKTFNIPKNDNAPDEETIPIPKFKADRDSYAKVFCEDKNYLFLAKGSTKLN